MKTPSTDERIAELEGWANACIQGDGSTTDDFIIAVAFELRALRLAVVDVLRDEIREAAWRLAPAGTVTRESYLAASPFEQPPAPAGIPYGKDSEEAQAIERVIAEADAERKASDE